MSYEEQIMSKDKYPSIFLPQMEAQLCYYLTPLTFFTKHAVLKIGVYISQPNDSPI